MKRVQRFGGQSTVRKQDVVLRYLTAYATALHKSGFHLSYVDAFCGSGWRLPAGMDNSAAPDLFGERLARDAYAGTAIKALTIRPPFDRYVFGDTSSRNLRALKTTVEDLIQRVPDPPCPEIIQADANELVQSECARLLTNSRFRAVVFLDPFGMQVDWTTLQAIQRSGRVDLWLLVPTAIGVARLLPRSGPPSEKWAAGLDRFFGTTDWKQKLLEANADLLGHIAPKRMVGLAAIVDFTMRRLEELFGPGLYPTALELRIRQRPAYHLIFACSSPSPGARQIAFRIAGHLLNRASKAG